MVIRPGRQGRRAGLGTARAFEQGVAARASSFFGKNTIGAGTLKQWLKADRDVVLSGTLKPLGTAPPVWTISGTPPHTIALRAEIDSVAGGTGLGQATFKWSTNAGVSYPAGQTGVATAASVLLPGTGITIAMAAGPYNVDNKYDSVVASWGDQSGLGNNASQATENRRNTISFTAMSGGRPSISIDANRNGIMSCDSLAAAFSGNDLPCTVLAALKNQDNARAGALLTFGDVSAAEMRYEVSTAAAKVRAQRAPDAGGLVTVTTTDAQVLTPEYVSFVYTGTAISVFLNGVATSLSGTALDTAATTFSTAAVGGTSAFSDIGIFDLAEILVYASALSTADRLRGEAYLKAKWGL